MARNHDDYAVSTLAGYAFGVDREEWKGYAGIPIVPSIAPGTRSTSKRFCGTSARWLRSPRRQNGERAGSRRRSETGVSEDAHGHRHGHGA